MRYTSVAPKVDTVSKLEPYVPHYSSNPSSISYHNHKLLGVSCLSNTRERPLVEGRVSLTAVEASCMNRMEGDHHVVSTTSYSVCVERLPIMSRYGLPGF